MDHDRTEEETQIHSGQKTAIVLLLVLLALAAVLILYLVNNRRPESERPTYETELAASLGQLEGKTAEEIQAALNQAVEDGMFHIAINADPVFANGEATGTLEIENTPGNRYLMRVEIAREDTGEVVYATKYIEPNHHIQRAALDKPLAAGDYVCVATFFAYDPDSLTEVGNVSSLVTIHVLN